MSCAPAAGIAAAILILLVKLSGSPVRRVLDGTVRASLKIRSPEERAQLRPLEYRVTVANGDDVHPVYGGGGHAERRRKIREAFRGERLRPWRRHRPAVVVAYEE